MKKCTEIAKNGNKSLVEVRSMETGRITQYVVCSNFNNAKRFGTKWDNGDYFDVWNGATEEEMCKAAMLYLYGIDTKKPEISYDRMSEIATKFLNLIDLDDEDNIEEIKSDIDLSETEAEYFEIKDKLFEKLYKIVEVTLTQTREVKVKVVMPDDEPDYNAEDYIENRSYLDDYDTNNEDWECEDYRTVREGLTKEDYEDMGYDDGEIWNDSDFRDGDI